MARIPILYLLGPVVAALALAACGGDGGSAEDFEEDVRGAQQELQSQLDEFRGLSPQDDVSEALANAAGALRDRADELEGSDVPEEAEEEREQLVESLRSIADDLEESANAVAEGGVGDLLENVQDLDIEAVREFEEAIERLREEGFDIEVSS